MKWLDVTDFTYYSVSEVSTLRPGLDYTI